MHLFTVLNYYKHADIDKKKMYKTCLGQETRFSYVQIQYKTVHTQILIFLIKKKKKRPTKRQWIRYSICLVQSLYTNHILLVHITYRLENTKASIIKFYTKLSFLHYNTKTISWSENKLFKTITITFRQNMTNHTSLLLCLKHRWSDNPT